MKTHGKSTVYMMADDGFGIKVGISNNPKFRVSAVSTSQRKRVALVESFSRENGDARLVERIAHILLRKKWLKGEWFDVSDDEARAAIQRAIAIVDSGDLAILDTAPPYPWLQESQEERVNLTMTKALVEAIDEWRRTQRDLPPRAEAIRRLVNASLNAAKKTKETTS